MDTEEESGGGRLGTDRVAKETTGFLGPRTFEPVGGHDPVDHVADHLVSRSIA
jgi:hypothetical protein